MTWLPSHMPVEVYDPPTLAQVLLIYVGLPLAFVVIVALLVSAPSWTRAGRHRPGSGWDSDPLWVESGGTRAALPAAADGSAPGQDGAPGTGGSSGRW
jgi:hypothetical protein